MDAVFHRIDLAERIVDLLLDPNPALAATSGLFLAAPRRTGKSTFVREDLRPELERRGALTIYVDLWAERRMDPGELVARAIHAALEARAGATGIVRRLGIDSMSIAGVSIGRGELGRTAPLTLSAALEALSDDVGRPIVLLIDEIQHASSTESGANALFGLKAARDELNSTRHHGLRLVGTGSNRDKLATLVNNKDQAFYLAGLTDLPLLGEDYVDWFVDQQPFAAELDRGAVNRLFERLGRRPEFLDQAARALRLELVQSDELRGERLVSLAEAALEAADRELLDLVDRLSPLQAAVLRVIAEEGRRLAPFDASSLARYGAILADGSTDAPRVTRSSVQSALGTLQRLGLVWRSTRGAYALEESRLAELLLQGANG